MRVLVLGAGFGGLELTTRLSDEFGDEIEVVLIDQADGFVFGFSKLDVMFGRTVADAVRHPYRYLVKPGVRFVQSTIRAIDPAARSVETDAGYFDGDFMVVALGADLDPGATPGLVEGGHEFYTVEGAFAARDVLAALSGGRIVVAVTSTPFKCPPAPSETALLVHDFLAERGRRDASEISLVMPMGVPIPPSPDASGALLAAFAERGIAWHPDQTVTALDPGRGVALCADKTELPYDLFLGVPVHRAPAVVQSSGMCVDGWVRVNSRTLETEFPGVYAVGDVTSVGAQGRGFRRGPGIGRSRGDHRQGPRTRRCTALRRPRDLLPRVRARPGGQSRCNFCAGSGAEREHAGTLRGTGRRQGGLRRQPRAALVRPRLAH